jgi:hypothetical protein
MTDGSRERRIEAVAAADVGGDRGYPGADAVVVDGRRSTPDVAPRECIVAGLQVVVVSTSEHEDIRVLVDEATDDAAADRLVRAVELDAAMDACFESARGGTAPGKLSTRVEELTAELGPDAVRVAAAGLLPRATS